MSRSYDGMPRFFGSRVFGTKRVGRRPGARPRQPRFSPRVEALETRVLLKGVSFHVSTQAATPGVFLNFAGGLGNPLTGGATW